MVGLTSHSEALCLECLQTRGGGGGGEREREREREGGREERINIVRKKGQRGWGCSSTCYVHMCESGIYDMELLLLGCEEHSYLINITRRLDLTVSCPRR